MTIDTSFNALELALDELDSINLYSEWTRDAKDKETLSEEVYEARRALAFLRTKEITD
jgi:hypothetical protein